MNILGIFVGIAGVSLICVVIWMLMLSMKQQRYEQEKRRHQELQRLHSEQMEVAEQQERREKAERGHIPTILYLAKEAEKSDLREALYWHEKAAHLENITGMYGIIRLAKRLSGDVVLQEKAKFWGGYIRGLEGDNASLFDTAKALISGSDILADQAKGIKLMERAGTANYIPAQIFLGEWSTAKENLSPKPEDSSFWFAKAAKLDDTRGMMQLGLNYLQGIGVTRDHLKAAYWLESAGEKGNAEAMYHAGKLWIDHGKDGNSMAYVWLFIAAHCGYEPAKSIRDEVGNKLGVDSVVVLQRFAKPLLRKIQENSLGKHLIIRAFNKIYKRYVPMPDMGDYLIDDELEDYSDNVLKALTDESDEEALDLEGDDSAIKDEDR